MTLTYDDDHLPTVTVDGERLPTISSADVIKFHRDLRKRFQQGYYNDTTLQKVGWSVSPTRIELDNNTRFKYYVTSEYGPQTHRPHLHGFYSALPTDEDTVLDLFQQIWGKGFVSVEKAKSEACAAYVSKYLVNDSLVPYDKRVAKPRAWMSKGIGSLYLDNEKFIDWHRQAPLEHQYTVVNGEKAILPRYWRDKIFDDDMKAQVQEQCIQREEMRQNWLDSLPAETVARLRKQEQHRQQEAVKQAEWRFRKNGKIK